jgi:predicted transcriptional regulator of viral defense system
MKKLTKYILSEFGGKVVKREEIEAICKKFKADAERTINFMISYGYLVRILRGLYYVKTLEEFKLKRSLDTLRIISLGMEKLEIEWYFGLHTALKLNGITHEYSAVIYVLNNTIYRPKAININGEDVKFIKLKNELFGFGIIEKNGIKFSDLEKTLLDMTYISRYRSVPEERVLSMIEEYGKRIRKRKIAEYLKFYPKSVRRVVENAGII